jgi:hypothetical protein
MVASFTARGRDFSKGRKSDPPKMTFSFTVVVRQMASAHSHRPFRFDLNMKFEHHHSRLSPQPVAVAEL